MSAEPQAVRIRWLDAFCDHEPTEQGDLTKRVEMTTVGYLVRSDASYVSVAAERVVQDGKVFWACTTTVPRVCLLGEPEELR